MELAIYIGERLFITRGLQTIFGTRGIQIGALLHPHCLCASYPQRLLEPLRLSLHVFGLRTFIHIDKSAPFPKVRVISIHLSSCHEMWIRCTLSAYRQRLCFTEYVRFATMERVPKLKNSFRKTFDQVKITRHSVGRQQRALASQRWDRFSAHLSSTMERVERVSQVKNKNRKLLTRSIQKHPVRHWQSFGCARMERRTTIAHLC